MGVPVKKGGKEKKSSKGGMVPQRTAEDFFEEAEVAFMSDDLDGARTAYSKAIEMEPENIEYLDAYGSFLAECGSREEAISILQRSCTISPDKGFQKYMYLGQVLDQEDKSEEAQVALRKGIEILRKELETCGEEGKQQQHDQDEDEDEFDEQPSPEELKEALSSALCSLAELLLGIAADPEATAAGDVANVDDEKIAAALEEAEQLLSEAQQLDPTSPEPLQALCSMRRLQDREEEALVLLKQSMALWFKPPTEQPEENQEDDENLDMDLEGMDLPSYEFRFETAKLLLELDETTESAVQVLEGLLEENDAVPHVWLLLAVAYRAGGDLEEAAEAVDEGLQVVNAMRLPADDEMHAALAALKTELESAKGGNE